MPKLYGWVREVVPGSLADEAGLQPGDLVEYINGHPIRDLVDFQFYSTDDELLLGVSRQEQKLEMRLYKEPDEGLGILFGEEPAPFIRQCANKCVFCFIDGLPKRREPQRGLPLGMRDSLYIKDDDFRYSFLFGNFITLTNLKDKDWQRLEEQRLSPLYVSVHVTDPELRRKMVDGPRAGDIMGHLQRLGDMGIQAHTQLVLCPEINDGEYLERSIQDLVEMRPIVQSISAVPVGLTKYNNMLKVGELPAMRPYRVDEALKVIKQVQKWQKKFESVDGDPFVYLSDEFYLMTKKKFPSHIHYGEFAQIENGVGMVRHLVYHWNKLRRKLPSRLPKAKKMTILTGMLAAPVIESIVADLEKIENLSVSLVPVVNKFFGPLVTASGLLVGNDLLDAAGKQEDLGDALVIPRVALDNAGERFLDDIQFEDFQKKVQVPVYTSRYAEDIAEVVQELAG